jgi:hypothetical protein
MTQGISKRGLRDWVAGCACVALRPCGNIYELCARSSAGSERLATNQKVGSSNLSGRTIFPFIFRGLDI